MSEDFYWVNVDMKEFISPVDFDYGGRAYNSSGANNDLLRALKDLLSDEWKNCRVLWMGEDLILPEENIAPELFSVMEKQCNEIGYQRDMFGTMCDTYKNVSGLFRNAETRVREFIGYYLAELDIGNEDEKNEYGVNPNDPYKDLFTRNGKDFKYTINYTKKVFYSIEETLVYMQNGILLDEIDPLPSLMGYGRTIKTGAWLGDIIGFSDEKPLGFRLLDRITIIDW